MSSGNEVVYEVPAETASERVDKVLQKAFPEFSRSQLHKFFDAGLVWIEDESVLKKQKVSAGDIITFTIPETKPASIHPVDIPLDIIYEDEDIIAINKTVGMVVHPGAGTGDDTLVHALLHHCKGSLSGIGGIERPGIVHRLDKETSGLIIAAKSDRAFLELGKIFAERRIKKEYLALVTGVPRVHSGIIEQPIGRHSTHRTRMTVRKDGRPARSDWKLIQPLNGSSLLRVHIHTGRTHQIRVHLSSLGHPLLGDELYGYRQLKTESTPSPRVMLHAARLSFAHPVTSQPMELEAPLPEDFKARMELLR